MWPFFIWWTLAMLFSFVAPIALALAWWLHAATDTALVAGLIARPRAPRCRCTSGRASASARSRSRACRKRSTATASSQISDLHCGPFASGRRVERWVAATNRIEADLVAVTGDLIASGSDFIDTVARALGGLRARDGAFAAMGNHDYFGDGEAMVSALEGAGLTVLRNRGLELRRDSAAIWLAGVDDTWTRRHDLGRALAGRPAGMPAVLLAHDPVLFPDAAERGVDLVLSGHTHGGQVAVPLLARKLNLARLITRFTSGVYQSGINHAVCEPGPGHDRTARAPGGRAGNRGDNVERSAAAPARAFESGSDPLRLRRRPLHLSCEDGNRGYTFRCPQGQTRSSSSHAGARRFALS